MRLSACWMGLEVNLGIDLAAGIDFYLGPTTIDDEPDDCGCAKPRLGDSLSIPVGFSPSLVPDWEKSLNRYDEPSEGDEDV